MPRLLHMKSSRRRFLIGAGALAATATIPNALFAYTGGSSPLVVVILHGALDGLAAPAVRKESAKAAYPNRVSAVARMASELMRSDGGPEIAVIEASGWYTHANQGRESSPRGWRDLTKAFNHSQTDWGRCGGKRRYWWSPNLAGPPP